MHVGPLIVEASRKYGGLGEGEQAGFLEEEVHIGGPPHLLGDPEHVFNLSGLQVLFAK